MWSNQVFHAVLKALNEAGQDSSFELPPIEIRGQSLVVKCYAPRGYAVDVSWGGLTIEGYHNSLSDRGFQEIFGFDQATIDTLAAYADKETRRIAAERHVLAAVDEIIAEWKLTPQQRYFRDLENLCGGLSNEQLEAVELYGWSFVNYRMNQIKLSALFEAFVALLLDFQIPREVAVQIMLVDDRHKNISW